MIIYRQYGSALSTNEIPMERMKDQHDGQDEISGVPLSRQEERRVRLCRDASDQSETLAIRTLNRTSFIRQAL